MKTFYCITLIIVLALSVGLTPHDAQAQSPTGVGVIGDSASKPYRCPTYGTYGDSTSFNWVEYARALRGINFGTGTTCASFVKAVPGSTVYNNMASQTTQLLTNINAGQIEKVVIMLGHNDVRNPNPAPGLVQTILGIYRTQLDRILAAGIAPSNVLMSGVLTSSYYKISANIAAFNQGLSDLAAEKGTVYVPWTLVPTQAYHVGGETISPISCNEYHCLMLGSPGQGHAGSVANGLIFNTFAFFFDVPPLSDAEILSLPQGVSAPTSTPAVTPTPTNTPTQTSTATVTPTPTVPATPTPFILDCGIGWHWVTLVPFDPQRVECVPN